MPTKKYSKKRGKKTYKRRAKGMVFRPQRILSTAFPKTTAVRLRYVDTVQIDASLTTMGQHVYSCNSPFKPDITGTGHQPMGFDEWTNLYRNYVVIGSVLKATTSGVSSTAGAMAVLGVTVSAGSATVSTDLSTYLEQARTNRAVLSRSYAARIKSVKKGFSPKKTFNITNILDNVAEYGAFFSLAPTTQAFWVISYGHIDPTTDPGAQSVLVEIEYTIIFSNPKQLTQS